MSATDRARRRWGKAGVRLTPGEAAHRDRKAGVDRALGEQVRAEGLRKARRLWETGMVVPHHITQALDMNKLHGPEVDVACGAAEPDVDMWEAGRLYPSWEQIVALGELTGMSPTWFMGPPRRSVLTGSSLGIHLPASPADPPPVYEFTAAALADAASMGVRA